MYLLAGLLRCGQCGRLLDSCWSHNRPAYRCRHGRSSATGPRLDGPRNLYLREDHVTPHLPALWIRLTNTEYPQSRPLRGPGLPTTGEITARLRAASLTLTYDPGGRTLTADTSSRERIAIG
ncbi:zinc ribbon domain-containing protein [Kitasatospora acidiphila]|uniref:zinc ribbon domain-containing protein n=1 Tax=Kitasatospora acidiphila TaxID=2567942 RepID=UPI003C763962